MDVTKHNFAELLPEIESSIDNCDFLSIDGEFTGLLAGNAINSFDTPSECYTKYRNGSKDFLLIQFGLSAFRWEEKSKSYKHRDYTFYLFPRQEIKSAPEKIFSCQSSSIEFLAKHKFDFNKLFYEGLSYIDTVEESRLREHLQEKQITEKELKLSSNDNSMMKDLITVPENFCQRVTEICKEVEMFLNKCDKSQNLEFNDLNGFQRKIIYQELQLKFNKAIFIETKILSNDKRQLVVTHGINENELKKKLEENHLKEWQDLETAIGFSVIARKISNSGKLVVGHCMILDILHSLQTFFHPLPEKYNEFKLLTSQLFTSILDTMYLLKTNIFKELFTSFDLTNVYLTLSKEPFKVPKIETENSKEDVAFELDKTKFHTAGYDACITGISFISLYEYLKSVNPDNIPNHSRDKLGSNSSLLKPYLNKLFLFKTSFQGSPYINLTGKDPSPSREHVFHITFPESWLRSDIIELFEPHGGVGFIAYIDKTSAYVSLKQHDQAAFVKSSLCLTNNKNYKILPFWRAKEAILVDEQKLKYQNKLISKSIDNIRAENENKNSYVVAANIMKRKLSIKGSDSDQDVEEVADESGKKRSAPNKDEKIKKRQRKLSHTSAGDFVVSEPEKNPKKKSELSNVFQESDSWE